MDLVPILSDGFFDCVLSEEVRKGKRKRLCGREEKESASLSPAPRTKTRHVRAVPYKARTRIWMQNVEYKSALQTLQSVLTKQEFIKLQEAIVIGAHYLVLVFGVLEVSLQTSPPSGVWFWKPKEAVFSPWVELSDSNWTFLSKSGTQPMAKLQPRAYLADFFPRVVESIVMSFLVSGKTGRQLLWVWEDNDETHKVHDIPFVCSGHEFATRVFLQSWKTSIMATQPTPSGEELVEIVPSDCRIRFRYSGCPHHSGPPLLVPHLKDVDYWPLGEKLRVDELHRHLKASGGTVLKGGNLFTLLEAPKRHLFFCPESVHLAHSALESTREMLPSRTHIRD